MKLISYLIIIIISILISNISKTIPSIIKGDFTIPSNILVIILSFLVNKLIISNNILKTKYFTDSNNFIYRAGEFGFLVYLFLSGMNFNIESYQTEIKDIIPMSISTLLINFSIYLLILKLFKFSWKNAIIIAIILSETFSNLFNGIKDTIYNNNIIKNTLSNLQFLNNVYVIILFVIIAFYFSFSLSDNIFLTTSLILFITGNILSKYLSYNQNINIKYVLDKIYNIFLPLFFIHISSFINLSNISLTIAFGLSLLSFIVINISGLFLHKFYNIDLKTLINLGQNIVGKTYLKIILSYIAYKNKVISANLLANIVVMFIINNLALEFYTTYIENKNVKMYLSSP
jgi:Kef-type K+ transport system membrane component KefB